MPGNGRPPLTVTMFISYLFSDIRHNGHNILLNQKGSENCYIIKCKFLLYSKRIGLNIYKQQDLMYLCNAYLI